VINIQPIEKADLREDASVEVHSIFYTIQGEGPLTGHPAVFIRLAGCNLQCPQCDTNYTSKRARMTPEAVVREVVKRAQPPRLVVITGGEPFRQNIGLLTQLLGDHGYSTQVETNGTLPPPEGLDIETVIVVSPKTGKVHPLTEERAWAYKYVLNVDSVGEDGLPNRVLDHTCGPGGVARPPQRLIEGPPMFPRGAVYLQPADVPNPMARHQNTKAVIKSCLDHGWTLQLQTHKILNLE
jgi:7-carboxy-7-deazaguanine synthase